MFTDGEFYHKGKVVYGDTTGIFLSYQGWIFWLLRILKQSEQLWKKNWENRKDTITYSHISNGVLLKWIIELIENIQSEWYNEFNC